MLEGELVRVVFSSTPSGLLPSSGPVLLWRGLERRRRCSCFAFLLEGLSSVASSPLVSFEVSTIYISYEEVAVQRPVGSGSCSSPTSSSTLSMSSESKSSTSVKSSTVAMKWVVGGQRIPSSPASTQAGHSSAQSLLTTRETLMSSACPQRESAGRYPQR